MGSVERCPRPNSARKASRFAPPSQAYRSSGPRFLVCVHPALTARHCGTHPDQAYGDWIRRFVLFHGKRPPSPSAPTSAVRRRRSRIRPRHSHGSERFGATTDLRPALLYGHVIDRTGRGLLKPQPSPVRRSMSGLSRNWVTRTQPVPAFLTLRQRSTFRPAGGGYYPEEGNVRWSYRQTRQSIVRWPRRTG